MWAGTWPGGGVAVLGEDQLKKVYTEADGLASDHVLCVLEGMRTAMCGSGRRPASLIFTTGYSPTTLRQMAYPTRGCALWHAHVLLEIGILKATQSVTRH
jgi:hypothetical protein